MRNSQELDNAARGWAAQAKADIQRQINEFKRTTRMSGEDLATMLGMSPNQISNFLNSGAIETFAKLLIASGNVLEVKPINEAMKDGFMPTPPRFGNGEMPRHPRFGRHEGAIPPPPFYPMPTAEDNEPSENRNGGDGIFDTFFSGKDTNESEEERESVKSFIDNIDNATRRDLVNFIYDKELEDEIDCLRASDEELVDFIKDTFAEDEVEEEDGDNAYDNFLGLLQQEIDKHPSLKGRISDIVNN
jgi:transcriptional regulator with XRE-family HTH domain